MDIIKIPSFLTSEISYENNLSTKAASGCTSFCEVYDECCNYENCMSESCRESCSESCGESCSESCGQSSNIKPSNPTSYPVAIEKSVNYIVVDLAVCARATGYTLFYKKSTASSWNPIDTSDTTVKVSPLDSGTSYEFKYSAYNSYGTSNESSISTATTQTPNTPPPTPKTEPRAITKGSNYLDLGIDYIATATSYILYYRKQGTSVWNSASTTTNAITITNLQSNTSYELAYSAKNNFGESSKSTISVATTANPTIEKWNWSFSTTSGSNFTLSASEWIQFLNTINTVRLSKKLTEYSFTMEPNYVSKGKNFSASLFRQACNSINDMVVVSSECLILTPTIDKEPKLKAY